MSGSPTNIHSLYLQDCKSLNGNNSMPLNLVGSFYKVISLTVSKFWALISLLQNVFLNDRGLDLKLFDHPYVF